jgi:hypothetical protein
MRNRGTQAKKLVEPRDNRDETTRPLIQGPIIEGMIWVMPAWNTTGLQHQLTLVQLYYDLRLPHQGLPQARRGNRGRLQAQTPAMALGLIDQVWQLKELLVIRVPPWLLPSLACCRLSWG